MVTENIILGHSENTAEGETPKIIKKKIISALNQKLNIILCIGEKYIDKPSNKNTKKVEFIEKEILSLMKY